VKQVQSQIKLRQQNSSEEEHKVTEKEAVNSVKPAVGAVPANTR